MSGRDRRRRVPATVSAIVTAQAIAIVVFGVLVRTPAGSVIAAAAAVGAFVVSVVPVGGRTLPRWLVHLSPRLRSDPYRDLPRAVLSCPRARRDTGFVWDGARLSAGVDVVVAVQTGWTTVDSSGSRPDAVVPLPDLVEALLVRSDAATTLDVCTVGFRPIPGSPAADAYLDLAGPLVGTAVRRTRLIVSVDACDVTRAARRRGGGMPGAMRVLVSRLDRIERVLRDAGLGCERLTPDHLRRVDVDVTQGYPPAGSIQSRRHFTLGPHRWSAWAVPATRMSPSTTDGVWAESAASTATTLRVTVEPGRGATVGYAFALENSAEDRCTVSGAVRSRGSRRGFGLFLPSMVAATPDPLGTATVSMDELSRFVGPVAGCGQLVGVDGDGAAVAARLFGPGAGTVHVRGELYVARQVVFRAIATGARVLIATDRPQGWHGVVGAAGPAHCVLAPPGAMIDRHHPPDIVVVDHAERHRPDPDVTTMFVTAPEQPSPVVDVDVSLDQLGGSGEHVVLSTGGSSIDLTLVTTGAESAVLGRPGPLPVRGRRQPG